VRPRVLFIAEAVTLAHVARARVLAGTLDPERFDVHVAWDPRFNELLGPLPFPWSAVHSVPTDVFLHRLSRGAPMHDVETLRGNVREDLALLERVKPDVVVGDFRLSLAASAKVAKVPHVAVFNAYWSPFGRQTFEFAEYDYPLSNMIGHRLSLSLFRKLRPMAFAAHTKPLNTVLREHGQPGIGSDIRAMYTFGDHTAYADIPELVPTYDLSSRHHYIGAALWSPVVPEPSWWNALPTDRPIIYATPGSSGDSDLLPTILGALEDEPVTVVAATAGHARVSRIPTNARVERFLPGQAAAARASLVLCNGGSPTTYQALTAGVPVLGLVSNNMDQHLNMQAVAESGAGEILKARGVTAPAIRAAVQRLLGTSSYREKAQRLARAHQACLATVRFPALIETAAGARVS